MREGALGKMYRDGEIIINQGETGSCMYVIQRGQVEVLKEHNGNTARLAILGEGEFFGEISLFSKEKRSATVRAMGDVRVLTVDKKILLSRVQEDLTLTFRIFKTMADRIINLNAELVDLKSPALAY